MTFREVILVLAVFASLGGELAIIYAKMVVCIAMFCSTRKMLDLL